MDKLQEQLALHTVTRKRVPRDDKAYKQTLDFCVEELDRLITDYRTTVTYDDMRARLLRDLIDHHLRRYHGYCIQGRIGSHYNQTDIDLIPGNVIFEHTIPARQARDLLISGVLTVEQALNIPTSRISRIGDQALRDHLLHDDNPNPWFFFRRYITAMGPTASFVRHDGSPITDPANYTLRDHFEWQNIS